ncbi:MAG: biotin/lipoyl-containing protein [Candidatus Obscuribacter sp.]|nr:biotin/lipoyl-containing protein [Candidatus Obscuribacter sp.]
MSELAVIIDGKKYQVEIKAPPRAGTSAFEVVVNGEKKLIEVPGWDQSIVEWHWFEIEGRSYEVDIDQELNWVKSPNGLHRIEVQDIRAGKQARPASRDNRVKAPIPGLITAVFVEAGQKVEAGQPLLILEAMKMENEINAPVTGVVSKLNAHVGKSALLNEVLAEIE